MALFAATRDDTNVFELNAARSLRQGGIAEPLEPLKLERLGVHWPHPARESADGEASDVDFLEKLLTSEVDRRCFQA